MGTRQITAEAISDILFALGRDPERAHVEELARNRYGGTAGNRITFLVGNPDKPTHRIIVDLDVELLAEPAEEITEQPETGPASVTWDEKHGLA